MPLPARSTAQCNECLVESATCSNQMLLFGQPSYHSYWVGLKFTTAVAIHFAVALPVTSAAAIERSAQLVESFRAFCILHLPNFSQIDEKATALQLPARNGENATLWDSHYQSKSWLVFLSSGPHELAGFEAISPRGKLTICGIRAPDVIGKYIRFDLTESMNLGDPVSVAVSPDGQQQITTWKLDALSNDITIVLTDNTPVQKPGINLQILHRAFAKS
jgi:hypothetical protein